MTSRISPKRKQRPQRGSAARRKGGKGPRAGKGAKARAAPAKTAKAQAAKAQADKTKAGKVHAAAGKAMSRRAAARTVTAADPLDEFIAGGARALNLEIERAWMPAVRANLRVTLAQAAIVGEFALPDDAEPAPVFHA